MITQADIDRDLDHAQTNGYFVDLSLHTVAAIVLDLRTCSQTCEGEPDEVLTPLVQTWYDAHRNLGDGEVGNAPHC